MLPTQHLTLRPTPRSAATPTWARRLAALALAVGLVPGLAACGSSSSAAPVTSATAGTVGQTVSTTTSAKDATTFVGKVGTTNSLVAITRTASGGVGAYFCDSGKVWGVLEGKVAGTTFAASDAAGTTFTAELGSRGLVGTLVSGGTTHQVTATPATGDAGAFLHEVRTGDNVVTIGWVRDNDGLVRGTRIAVDLSALKTLPSFSSEQKRLIDEIASTGIIPSGTTAGVTSDAVPFSFGSAIRCGFAAFKFRRIQSQPDTTAGYAAAFGEAVKGLESACGIDIPNF